MVLLQQAYHYSNVQRWTCIWECNLDSITVFGGLLPFRKWKCTWACARRCHVCWMMFNTVWGLICGTGGREMRKPKTLGTTRSCSHNHLHSAQMFSNPNNMFCRVQMMCFKQTFVMSMLTEKTHSTQKELLPSISQEREASCNLCFCYRYIFVLCTCGWENAFVKNIQKLSCAELSPWWIFL